MTDLPMNQKKKKSLRRCCVSVCTTEPCSANASKNRLYRFVQWPDDETEDFHKQLAKRRFWLWVTILEQDPRIAGKTWICYNHFVSGRPADPWCYLDEDWIPNQNLPISSIENKVLKNPCSENQEPQVNSIENITPLPDSSSIASVDHSESKVNLLPPEPELEGPFCRFCFVKDINLHPLFPSPRIDDNHLLKIIEVVAGIQLNFQTDYNSFICHECKQRLEEFYKCRKMWQANDAILSTLREKSCCVESSISLVSIPIEVLIQDSSIESDYEATKAGADDELVIMTHNLSPQNDEENRSEDNLPDASQNSVLSSEELATDPILEDEPSQNTPNVQAHDEPVVILDTSDSTDSEEKDELIKKVMRKIRRKTFSPSKRKAKDEARCNRTQK